MRCGIIIARRAKSARFENLGESISHLREIPRCDRSRGRSRNGGGRLYITALHVYYFASAA